MRLCMNENMCLHCLEEGDWTNEDVCPKCQSEGHKSPWEVSRCPACNKIYQEKMDKLCGRKIREIYGEVALFSSDISDLRVMFKEDGESDFSSFAEYLKKEFGTEDNHYTDQEILSKRMKISVKDLEYGNRYG